jgi:thiamine biosynthesis lipoprotein
MMQSYIRFSSLVLFLILSFSSCKIDSHAESVNTGYVRIKGKTMGTTYAVTYQDAAQINYKSQIDSLLAAINQEVSTYIPSANISIFNQKTDKSLIVSAEKNPHFVANILESQKIFEATNGHFDPTVMPLVNYWGFGYTEKKAITNVDKLKIDTLLQSVGFDKLEIEVTGEKTYVISKANSEMQLDFSAIAKGYAVDAVGNYLVSQGIENYFVEIGGETVCSGKSPRGDIWALGISVPSKDAETTDIQEIVKFTNKGLATSGNYRNYHTSEDGSIYAHTINPKTGFPEKSNLLSATVIAENCMIADAYATAFMVMGKDMAIEFAKSLPNIEIYLIFGDENGEMQTFYTDGFTEFLSKDAAR